PRWPLTQPTIGVLLLRHLCWVCGRCKLLGARALLWQCPRLAFRGGCSFQTRQTPQAFAKKHALRRCWYLCVGLKFLAKRPALQRNPQWPANRSCFLLTDLASTPPTYPPAAALAAPHVKHRALLSMCQIFVHGAPLHLGKPLKLPPLAASNFALWLIPDNTQK